MMRSRSFFIGFYFEIGLSNWRLILCSRDTCDLMSKCDNVLCFRTKLQFCRPLKIGPFSRGIKTRSKGLKLIVSGLFFHIIRNFSTILPLGLLRLFSKRNRPFRGWLITEYWVDLKIAAFFAKIFFANRVHFAFDILCIMITYIIYEANFVAQSRAAMKLKKNLQKSNPPSR